MKKLLPLMLLLATAPDARADITAKYVTSAQITIDAP